MFNPSPQQLAFFDFLRTDSRNAILSACAGSGKTTTIIKGFDQIPSVTKSFIPPSIVYTAFSKDVVAAVKGRCPRHVDVTTCHALGRRALVDSGRYDPKVVARRGDDGFVQGRKVSKLLYNILGKTEDTKNAIRLASIARTTVTLPEDMDATYLGDLAERYTLVLDEPSRVFDAVRKAIVQAVADLSCIDFDEMLYLPIILGCKFSKQDYVFVDEAQDMNDIQLEIMSRLEKPGQRHEGENPITGQWEVVTADSPTRFFFVGDPHQAIYGFRGANSDSMQRIALRFLCVELPLSVSFRCPKAVVAEAQKFLQVA